jgi:anthranilate phosphoribosyltransferase
MDEISTLGKTMVAELHSDGEIQAYTLEPKQFGITIAEEREILCSFDREEESLHFLRILGGEELNSRRDIVCLNAAPILYMMGKAPSLEEAYHRAQDIVDGGRALIKLKEFVRSQNSHPEASSARFEALMEKASMVT